MSEKSIFYQNWQPESDAKAQEVALPKVPSVQDRIQRLLKKVFSGSNFDPDTRPEIAGHDRKVDKHFRDTLGAIDAATNMRELLAIFDPAWKTESQELPTDPTQLLALLESTFGEYRNKVNITFSPDENVPAGKEQVVTDLMWQTVRSVVDQKHRRLLLADKK